MKNTAFEERITELNRTDNEARDGVRKLARKHTAARKTETVGGYFRPFDIERDLNCFQCVFGESHPFWDELWPFLKQYGVDVEDFRNTVFARTWAGCQSGQVYGLNGQFWSDLRMGLWAAIRRKA